MPTNRLKHYKMRLQTFFETLQEYMTLDLQRTFYFMKNTNFCGGWEVWLQCDIGYAFHLYDIKTQNSTKLQREVYYPSGNNAFPYLKYNNKPPSVTFVNNKNHASRCDFLINRPQKGPSDNTFLEIKCQNSQEYPGKTWERFAWDVLKTETISKNNKEITCINLLCFYGAIDSDIINAIKAFDRITLSARLLDFAESPPKEYAISSLKESNVERTLILGVSINR